MRDLNSDLGGWFGLGAMGDDALMFPITTSASIVHGVQFASFTYL